MITLTKAKKDDCVDNERVVVVVVVVVAVVVLVRVGVRAIITIIISLTDFAYCGW